MDIGLLLIDKFREATQHLFGSIPEKFQIQPTNAEFAGSHTLVCFPITKLSKKSPEETGRMIGDHLVQHSGIVKEFNVVKGFLNLVITDHAWMEVFKSIFADGDFGFAKPNGKEIMVEYSSPNTNKPLHLGHLRNNFLGWSVSEIHKAIGYNVHKVQIINDRGIHICKSMAAWKLFGNGETPQSSGIKGDHLVGKYYVAFDKQFKKETAALIESGVPEAEAEKQSSIMKLASGMLRKWEAKDPDTVKLWSLMNGWVYDGFEVTYRRMGVDFEKLYFESNTYLLGKDEVLKGVESGVFFRKDDGSVWVDLTADGLDQKVLLRSDGTSVYMTQDIGTAILRFRDFPKIERQVYTVGNEQDYHFRVLFLILAKLGYTWAKECYHLSYGMVDLPTGKMKSREGTVVDADDLMQEVINEAELVTRELGKTNEMTEDEARELFEMIGLGALKYFLLKVDPKKKMMFDPSESVQLHGNTAPFIQYTHARISNLVRTAHEKNIKPTTADLAAIQSLEPSERKVIQLLHLFPAKLNEAAREYAPSVVANYVYDLAKEFNQFYQSVKIFGGDPARVPFRIAFSGVVADVLKRSMGVLGIRVPERM